MTPELKEARYLFDEAMGGELVLPSPKRLLKNLTAAGLDVRRIGKAGGTVMAELPAGVKLVADGGSVVAMTPEATQTFHHTPDGWINAVAVAVRGVDDLLEAREVRADIIDGMKALADFGDPIDYKLVVTAVCMACDMHGADYSAKDDGDEAVITLPHNVTVTLFSRRTWVSIDTCGVCDLIPHGGKVEPFATAETVEKMAQAISA